ncbi:MAG: hypothetical protein OXI57_06555 [Rhodospirillales bacterium]|nr:hypothetical protein [Rhodospirillales bacterium]
MIASAKRYMTAFAAAALIAVGVSACGGGGPTTTLTPVDLGPVTDGFMAEAGTLEIEAGETVVRGDIAFSCAADGDDCTVTVTVEDGRIGATSTGGMVTAMNSAAYAESLRTRSVSLSGVTAGFTAEDGTVTIRAGQTAVYGDIRFSCAAGRYDCEVTVTVADDGTITAASTGGTVTAMNAPGYPPDTMTVDLSDVTVGFLAEAITMLEIDAGDSKNHGDIRFSCAAGGRDCVVMVMVDAGGNVTATSTGGDVTASDAGSPDTLADRTREDAIETGHSTNVPNLQTSGAPDDGLGYSEMTGTMHAEIGGRPAEVYELVTPATGTDAAMTDTLVIYSNVPFLTPTEFEEVYPFDVNADPNQGNDALAIAIGATAQVDVELIVGDMPSSNVPQDGTFRGTFDGAAGEYTCTDSGGCTLSFDSGGNVTDVSGDMHFTPDAGETVLATDPDYMYFGYWLRESEDSGGDPTFEVAGLYGGAEPSDINDVQILEGSATYEGAATGLYVRRWTDANNDVVRRRAGQFSADVMLEANFGGDTVPAIDHYSISGTIGNFMAGGRALDPNWHLALRRAE